MSQKDVVIESAATVAFDNNNNNSVVIDQNVKQLLLPISPPSSMEDENNCTTTDEEDEEIPHHQEEEEQQHHQQQQEETECSLENDCSQNNLNSHHQNQNLPSSASFRNLNPANGVVLFEHLPKTPEQQPTVAAAAADQKSSNSAELWVSGFEVSSLKNAFGASGLESQPFMELLELRDKDNKLQNLMRDIKLAAKKCELRAAALAEALARTTREGRECRLNGLKPFSGQNSPGFSLNSKTTLKTPHLCHISSIQFFEAKLYKKFKHVQSFPQSVQMHSGNLRIFASTNMTVRRISSMLEEKKEMIKVLEKLCQLKTIVLQEIDCVQERLENVKKAIVKHRGGKKLKYIGIKNRYFASLRLINPISSAPATVPSSCPFAPEWSDKKDEAEEDSSQPPVLQSSSFSAPAASTILAFPQNPAAEECAQTLLQRLQSRTAELTSGSRIPVLI